jgi:RHS repeat-associated protein
MENPAPLPVPDSKLRLRYYHQDHLGSSSVLTAKAGQLVEETAFYPFGHPRHEFSSRGLDESYQFTQKERDRESGLHYFDARYLAAGLSRFIGVDPKQPELPRSGKIHN